MSKWQMIWNSERALFLIALVILSLVVPPIMIFLSDPKHYFSKLKNKMHAPGLLAVAIKGLGLIFFKTALFGKTPGHTEIHKDPQEKVSKGKKQQEELQEY